MDIPWEPLVDRVLTLSVRVGAAILIYAVFHIAACLVRGAIGRVADTLDPSRQNVVRLLGQVAKVALMIVGAITALGTLGVNVTAMVAGLGLTGFALGFAVEFRYGRAAGAGQGHFPEMRFRTPPVDRCILVVKSQARIGKRGSEASLASGG